MLSRRIRPLPYRFWWMLALGVLLLLTGGFLWAGMHLPLLLSLPIWWPDGNLLILLDVFSWPYAFGLLALVMAVLLTAPARASRLPTAWAANLLVLAAAWLAVLAGNLLTLALAWALLDAIELALLLLRTRERSARERLVAVFAARQGGILLLLWGGTQEGGAHTFAALPRQFNILLLLSVAMRLGVFPLHVPFLRGEPAVWRGLGTTLRLAAPTASLGLLTHIARTGVAAQWVSPLTTAAWLAGLLGALGLWNAENELSARPFWVLGCSALAVGAALRARPEAAVAWGVLMLVDGGLLFLSNVREPHAMGLPLLATALLIGLPFTPAWVGAQTYLQPLTLISVGWMLVHLLLLAGYVRHMWPAREHRSISPAERLTYLSGLSLLAVSGWLTALPGGGWKARGSAIHLLVFGLTGLLLAWSRRIRRKPLPLARPAVTALVQLLSFDWLYRIGWRGYRLLAGAVSLLALGLEGEGGLLWMFFLLLVVIAVLSTRFAGGLLP